MEDFHDSLLATSIRMHSLYQMALALCSVKRLEELTEQLLPHCITAMDVGTACLLTRDGSLHTQGLALTDLDQKYLMGRSWRDTYPCVEGQLPSEVSFLASPI